MEKSREQIIVRTSVIGIAANVLLAAFKAAVGLVSNSVAVILDAVNNLSDAMSSLITIIGTKLAQKAPDRKHPLGYGRVEYLSATVIAVIVLYAGVTSFTESVRKIITPDTPDYSVTALVIIAAAVAVKLALGIRVKRTGQRVDSGALVASGSDAMFDAVISASTLVAAIIFLTTGVSLEAWLGAVISIVIIKSGFEMLRDTIDDILGKRIDAELTHAVKASVTSFDEVFGAYDLIVHSYGPERMIGSVHIEVPDTMTAEALDTLERAITQRVFTDTGVVMTGISVYSVNTQNDEAAAMRSAVLAMLQMHGFYADEAAKSMKFDLIVSFDAKDRAAVLREIEQRVKALYPAWQVCIALDYDISD